jgi:hypothetical protein
MFASLDPGSGPSGCIPPAQWLDGGDGSYDCRCGPGGQLRVAAGAAPWAARPSPPGRGCPTLAPHLRPLAPPLPNPARDPPPHPPALHPHLNPPPCCRYPDSVVKGWSVAATFGPRRPRSARFDLFNKTLAVMVEGAPAVNVTVRVIDKCADADCRGCCSRNTGRGRWRLIDIEKWPAAALLGFDPGAPGFDINSVDAPGNGGRRRGAPKGVMPLCYRVLADGTAGIL